MHWSNKYLGVPWLTGGRNPAKGVDCWGLLCYVYLAEYSIHISEHANNSLVEHDQRQTLFQEESNTPTWHEVTDPQDGDAVAMGRNGVMSHVGIFVLSDNKPHILHVYKNTTASIWPLRRLERSGWNTFRYYRHDLRL